MTEDRDAKSSGGKTEEIHRGELYAAYVEFMADATRAALPLEPNDYAREEFIRIHRPHSREEFDRCLDELTAQPDRLKKFCQLISDGFSSKKVWGKSNTGKQRERDGR